MAFILLVCGSMVDPPERIPPASAGRSLLIDDAAQLLGVSRRTVYYRIREGRLQTIRTRCGSQRVLVTSIESLLREMRHRQAGAAPAVADRLPSEVASRRVNVEAVRAAAP